MPSIPHTSDSGFRTCPNSGENVFDIEACLKQLRHTRMSFQSAITSVQKKPGLYAIFGDANTWQELGLGTPPDDRPLYAGKSEKSLVERPLGQHFGYRVGTRSRTTSITGWSTLRRSLAALLHDRLKLMACPRNIANPGYYEKFGLAAEGDQALTKWMCQHLVLAVWEYTGITPPHTVECQVKQRLLPPLNCDFHTPWRELVLEARQAMAHCAQNWCNKQ